MKVDLHSHTKASDGHLTPTELVERAVIKCVDMLAITDHDTVAGLEEARTHIKNKAYGLKLIDGVELSTQWQGFEIHVVGLNVDTSDEVFLNRLASQSNARRVRAEKIAEKLTKYEFADSAQRAFEYAKDQQICRSHFARALLDLGYVGNFDEAFKKFLGKKARAYVPPQWVSLQEGIKWIQDAKGQAVLAHPQHYDLSNKFLRKLFAEFAAAGGDAMEAAQTQMSSSVRDQMVNYANEYGLSCSVGSDFHQPAGWAELGKNLSLPEKANPVWKNF